MGSHNFTPSGVFSSLLLPFCFAHAESVSSLGQSEKGDKAETFSVRLSKYRGVLEYFVIVAAEPDR